MADNILIVIICIMDVSTEISFLRQMKSQCPLNVFKLILPYIETKV